MAVLARKERLRIASRNTAQPNSISAPIKGWNTRDALDAMDPLEAIQLDNWYPDAGGVIVRNGYTSYATTQALPAFSSGFSQGFRIARSYTGAVKTLAEYNFGATSKLLAAGSGRFFDISASGASGPPIKEGFTEDGWQYVPFLSRLFFVNGADTGQIYDGTTFSDMTFTGVTLSTLIGVVSYQQRLFFWQRNSTKFWYAPLNSISGALASYDLSAFSPRGGNLTTAVTFSHDGGNGVTDLIAFVMSSGDCLIYSGNDPSNASAWSLVGRYRISPPVGIRAVCNYGAEAFLTTADDHVPMQQQLVALKLGQLPPRSKVSNAVQAAVVANSGAFGWQALYYPAGRRLIFNVPNTDGTFDQHICNTGSNDQPWCRFKNMNAYCWGLFGNGLYFGAANGVIYKADTGNLDNLGTINAVGQQSWNTFGSPLRKQVTASRPVVQSAGATYTFSLGFDYGAINIPVMASASVIGSPWDTSPWDTSPWSSDTTISSAWHGGGGSGVAIGWALSIASNRSNSWLRTDFRGQKGSFL